LDEYHKFEESYATLVTKKQMKFNWRHRGNLLPSNLLEQMQMDFRSRCNGNGHVAALCLRT